MALSAADARTFERCIAVGGIAVFPADTVYGLACEPDTKEAVQRLYMLKRRRPDKPAAVMFFALDLALAALPELGPRTTRRAARAAARSRHRAAAQPRGPLPARVRDRPATLGLRVPAWPPALAAMADVRWPVLQSSANAAGGPDARRLEEVPEYMREHTDLVLDGGELPGTPSTVVDLRSYEADGEFFVAREGAMSVTELSARLESAP